MASSSKTPSILSADLRITGNIVSDGDIQIDGVLEGDVSSGSVTIGDGARMTGNIVAEHVIIRGEVQGGVNASSVQLSQSARMIGDIVHDQLSIELGAHLEGRCSRRNGPADTPNPTDSSGSGSAAATARLEKQAK